MKSVRHFEFTMAIVAISTLLGACASTKRAEEPLTPASSNDTAVTYDEVADEESRPCDSNLDCGPGYACGFDHARSHVVRQCTKQ